MSEENAMSEASASNDKPSSLINRAAVKRFARLVGSQRSHPMTRVSDDFVERMENHLRNYIEMHVNSLPSVGKTIT